MIRDIQILAVDFGLGIHFQTSFLHNEWWNQVVFHRRNMEGIFNYEQVRLQTKWAVIRYHHIIDGDALELRDFITECIDISK